MVIEPEAAAIYAAQYLRQFMRRDILKVNPFDQVSVDAAESLQQGECFLICDAGVRAVVRAHQLHKVLFSNGFILTQGRGSIQSNGSRTKS